MQTLKRLKADYPMLPVVMLTGQGDEEVAVALMKAGAVDYLPKSAATPERLAASVRYALELARANAQTRDLIEELRRTAESERRARADAEDANRAKADFLARMSHDLRTPLNAIGGFTDLVLLGVYGPVNESQRQALDRVQRAQQHLLTLINDILGFARLEAGQVTLSLTAVPVAAVFDEIRQLMEPQAAAKGLRIEWLMGPQAAQVHADEQRLKQVLLNLAGNAVKFTSAGSVSLGWELADARVAMRVRDTGPGIPTEKLSAIFEPFVQAGNSEGSTSDGVGLGLAISRELTRLMGGTLSVESTPGLGSTFTVELPASPA
jgi:signal transduction histidine kinase